MSTGEESRAIKVAQLVKCLELGGTERQVVELMRGLDRGRVSPTLACLIKRGEFLHPLRKLQIDPPEFALRGSLIRANTFRQVARLASWLRQEKAAILHCHDFYSNIMGSLAARMAGIPWIISRRDLGVWGGATHRRLRLAATRRAPAVLCNSQAVRNLVVYGEGIPAERVHVIPNGLDLASFDREAAKPINPPHAALAGASPLVTIVANLKLKVKGHSDFLSAAVRVKREVEGVRFLIIGDGELRPEIEAQAEALGLRGSMIFTGFRTDVPSLLVRSTIAVSASHSEGLSNAIMEAMAAALPVVATNAGGNSELVRDGETGFVVPISRPHLLAASIISLLQEPERAKRMGATGRRRIETEFSLHQLNARVAALYEELSMNRGHVYSPVPAAF